MKPESLAIKEKMFCIYVVLFYVSVNKLMKKPQREHPSGLIP